ncbi:MAG: cysteine synthase A [Verrucomicrobia bacterium]|nr:cysteine synthase A [Verrucomicrobiota bacterium]
MKTKLLDNLCELIGGTPLLKMDRYAAGLPGKVVGKLEAYNPGWCVKDRIGLAMIQAAEKDGRLAPGGTIVEPTSGNTGIGLALASAVRGYHCILTMPSSMSVERRKILQGLGAELILTEGHAGMRGAIETARELAEEIDGSFMPQQFDNPANPEVHYRTTGPEIWSTLEGKVDILVSGVGTGGTISGAGAYLKEQNPKIRIIAVEPEESAILSGRKAGPHMIQGIGAGFVPGVYRADIVDGVETVSGPDAIAAAQQVAISEGLICGISSGAAACVARRLAQDSANAGKTIVAVMPDTGERYISTLLFFHD